MEGDEEWDWGLMGFNEMKFEAEVSTFSKGEAHGQLTRTNMGMLLHFAFNCRFIYDF